MSAKRNEQQAGLAALKQLTREQLDFFNQNGFLVLENFVSEKWLDRLNKVTAEFIKLSRTVTKSGYPFDIEPDHSADMPRLRRLINPDDQHETYWEVASESSIVDVAEDILGGNIKFHHSKLNFKSPQGGEEVKWYQDRHYISGATGRTIRTQRLLE